MLKGSSLPGDLFLLCSDGLTDPVPDTEIRPILEKDLTEDAMADLLIHKALESGGRDNVTVVLARIIG